MRVHWCVRVRYACVQYPYGARACPCVFCAVLCGCVLPTGAGCTVGIYTGAYALHFPRVHVRYGVRLGQPKQCILYMYVCMYGGRHVQPARCTTRREYVYACVVQYNTWAAWAACVVYMSACACTYVLCLYHLHSVLAWTAGAMHHLCFDPRAWTHTLYLYTYSFYGMDSLSDAPTVFRPACLGSHVVLVYVQVYGMDNLGDAPIEPACLGSHAVLVSVQHLAWTAWAMHRSRDGPRTWARTSYLYPYSIWHG